MLTKVLKYAKYIIAIAALVSFLYLNEETSWVDPYLILSILGFLYIVVSIASVLSLKAFDQKESDSFFPYRKNYYGINSGLFFVLAFLIPILMFTQSQITMGVLYLILFPTELIEKIIKKKKGLLYNVVFGEDRIIINEDQYNEVLYKQISSIEVVEGNKLKVITKPEQDDAIMNVDRIRKDRREDFRTKLLSLQPVVQEELTEN